MNAHDFIPYSKKIDRYIFDFIPTLGPKTKLRDAIEYSLLAGGGKRFRPAIVLMVSEELHYKEPIEAALAVEFFHTASLIADDLPCMDDELYRRGKAALHHNFDEAIALLTTYALIAEGYKKIQQASLNLPPQIGSLALERATENTGLFGATGGQFFDLYPPREVDEQSISQIMKMKTGALFELSFVFGWLFGGGVVTSLDLVKNAAYHFGMAYQISDDIEDLDLDKDRESKINFAAVCGIETAEKRVNQEIKAFKEALIQLNLSLPLLQTITSSSSSTGTEAFKERAVTSV